MAASTDVLAAFALVDRVAVVTGGAAGIGRAIVQALAGAGAHIVIADIDLGGATSAAREVEAMGRQALAVGLDVADHDAVIGLASRVEEAFGSVDVLVNDAGICVNEPAESTSDEGWRRVLAVNLDGTYWCSREIGQLMRRQRRGSIVNIASMSGLVVNWPQPQSAYNASKAAVIQLTRSLASEWASAGIRVNSVSPGYIGTAMTKRGMATPGWGETWLDRSPMRRLGEPIDVAHAVLYLASDAAAFVTGSNLVVDGGYTVW
jgi:NAD(P)-dependent dehydrogenase (short-subunit alcohol dehydrogenase family)